MAAQYVQLAPDSTGKKVQSYENTISSNVVEAPSVSVIDPTDWSNNYVQIAPDSTGKKIQYFENIIGGNTVNAIACVSVDSTGTPI